VYYLKQSAHDKGKAKTCVAQIVNEGRLGARRQKQRASSKTGQNQPNMQYYRPRRIHLPKETNG
jgi:hypothetical protein